MVRRLILIALLMCVAVSAGQVYVLPVKGAIDKGLLTVLRRAFRETKRLRPAAVVLELDTPGGGIEDTKELIAWIRSTRQGGCPVYAWVHSDALSAGAMLALACDKIYMSRGGTIGSAMPISVSITGNIERLEPDVQEKMLSAIRGMVTALAQENGYRPEIASAMVDRNHPDLDFTDAEGRSFHCPKGQLLNLTDRDAALVPKGTTQPLCSSGNAESLKELLQKVGLPDATATEFRLLPADQFARWITSLSPLLFSLAFLLLFAEMVTPGFGVMGFSGIALLAVCLLGHHLAGLAGVEALVLFVAGIILLALEIFVIPGFGITGISGIACLLVAFVLAMLPVLPEARPLEGLPAPSLMELLPGAIVKLAICMALTIGGAMLLLRYLPKVPILRGIVLEKSLATGNGATAEAAQQRAALVGATGVAFTDLRPAGTAEIHGKRIDVLTAGEYIRKGAAIRVVAENGTGIVVEAQEEARG